jgi:hypothetical protein
LTATSYSASFLASFDAPQPMVERRVVKKMKERARCFGDGTEWTRFRGSRGCAKGSYRFLSRPRSSQSSSECEGGEKSETTVSLAAFQNFPCSLFPRERLYSGLYCDKLHSIVSGIGLYLKKPSDEFLQPVCGRPSLEDICRREEAIPPARTTEPDVHKENDKL